MILREEEYLIIEREPGAACRLQFNIAPDPAGEGFQIAMLLQSEHSPSSGSGPNSGRSSSRSPDGAGLVMHLSAAEALALHRWLDQQLAPKPDQAEPDPRKHH